MPSVTKTTKNILRYGRSRFFISYDRSIVATERLNQGQLPFHFITHNFGEPTLLTVSEFLAIVWPYVTDLF
ncbi:hypothetical protein ES703_17179 [subsurface metagenome]